MNKIKILHCADIHIGHNFRNYKGLSQVRRSEIMDTFKDIVKCATEYKSDFILIAGDLFDDTCISDTEVKQIKSILSNSHCIAVISPGNHDPFSYDSPYNSKWPENVYIFSKPELSYFEFKHLGARIWGCAFTGMYSQGIDLTTNISDNDQLINICVTHADIYSGISPDRYYNPLSTDNISKSLMDYIALGHIHKRTPILSAGNVHYAYPGCPEGLTLGETGAKGFYIGEISKNECRLEFRRACKRLIENINIDISNAESSDDAIKIIMSSISSGFGENFRNNIYKIILFGMPPSDSFIDFFHVQRILSEDLFFVSIEDNTQPDISSYEGYCGNDLKSRFASKIIEKMAHTSNEDEIKNLQNALKIGLLAFSGEVSYNDNQ